MNKTFSSFLSTTIPVLMIAVLLHAAPSSAQDATPEAARDPCQAAPGEWPAWPMDRGMMQAPEAMGPGMMGTPAGMGPGMVSDANLMIATMVLVNNRIDEALAQAALDRVEQSDLRRFARDIIEARRHEGDQLKTWRDGHYPELAMQPWDQMLAMMHGMIGPMVDGRMGPMTQGSAWPGMGQMPDMMGNSLATLCGSSGPADRLFIDSLGSRNEMMLAMLAMMQPVVTDSDVQGILKDSVARRQHDLDQLQAWREAASPDALAGTPVAATVDGPTVVSYDIYFEPKELTIPADTDVTVTLPNEGATLHNFSIEALGISVDIDPGETETVTINAPAGTYDFVCVIPGHKEAGMVGILTVQK